MKKKLVSLIILTLSLVVCGCGGAGTPTASADTSAASAPAEGTGVGTTVEQGGYALTLVAIKDPATPGSRHTPPPGTRLIAAEIILRNVAGARELRVEPLNATLFDTEGSSYTADVRALDEQLERAVLDTGDEVRGWVGFNINEDTEPARFEFEFVFGNKVEIKLNE